MLEDIGESEQTAFFAGDVSDFLDSRPVLIAAEHLVEPIVLVSKIIDVESCGGDLLAEMELAFCDVFVVVVVESCRADVFVL